MKPTETTDPETTAEASTLADEVAASPTPLVPRAHAGVPSAVLSSNVGEYGTISWLSYGASLAQLEETNSKTSTDPGFLQRLEESAGFFVPGSGVGVLSRKIG